MILTDEQEAKKDEIVIGEIDPKTLSAMIHYLYTGDLIEEAWTSRWWPTLPLSTGFRASWTFSASR